ncbi:monofunctional biosynthetic peptidoglycan transglycosylase [Leeia sp. TBRC 13508]|uniref:Biosynthetic peptidoglycan transglycosylase n=2 Tax=Leeia speluncae TaxID=2884804 RepID=A0ABS8D7H7_9NEIS|nr:monofunctional biosynthetic peptidoglycan transglycosylase [Leeia speluncae]MCB6184116.1 monofunctional biosynthetic peptidoglycan transglycosylase [Leeia speluncae]
MNTTASTGAKPMTSSKGIWYWTKRIVFWLFILFIVFNVYVFVRIWWMIDHNPDTTSFMNDQLAEIRQTNPDAQIQHQWVDYDHISRNLKAALIASEDAKFVDHNGFDKEGIKLAFQKNLKQGRIAAGGSTISQQLAKNLFLSASKNPLRKGEEALITIMLEQMMTKERIFEIYLNSIEWGVGVFGAEAAARHYFNTSASRLSARQAAKLAAMVPNPRYFDKNRQDAKLRRKTSIILRRMGASDIPD